ncbi:N-formylglutamate amidohydrolase [Polaromonas sp. CG_23.6]|uniref:N-formylglutamate amidohydrolase n=1 Tax=Polaromonas sp. CG_23.6 TaxID=2760709 RepID=UPI0024746A7C|nr:N-formylglutamate amidohydrolase [Polaromonas sp. CG_23.6]MDH6186878.1 N-formylglutamate deformylase [Polaromonas sp. CG_23.6]
MMPFQLFSPPTSEQRTVPVFLDSPHSGTYYPGDFNYTCRLEDLRDAEDTHVEKLYADAKSLKIPFLCANFPRSYIDPNRNEEDLDYTMIADLHKPEGMQQWEEKLKLGKGLIWRYLDSGEQIYDQPLTAKMVDVRLDNFYRPYRRALRQIATAKLLEHGTYVHINCHSMPCVAGPLATLTPGVVHPDVVLGDRGLTACAPELTEALKQVCKDAGLNVMVNDPYPGGPITGEMGLMGMGGHSIQIELNRALYMNEKTRELASGYEATRELCNKFMLSAIEVANDLCAKLK